ncbi:retrovirus-related pol polyprotein from transposon TNT 1-94 [Tanacetum coccineum]
MASLGIAMPSPGTVRASLKPLCVKLQSCPVSSQIESKLADGTKSYLVGIVKNVEVYIGNLKLLEDLYVIDMEKDPTCPLLVGRGFIATARAIIGCRKAKIAVGEGITRLIFGVREINLGSVPANELKIYKEQVAIYEQRAKFELTEREQRMDDQMRMLIQNHNKTEENLKKELHSVKLQLNSTMENNKIIEGTVTTLKQELKQKESKFLTDFSNLKHLNDKLENKLHSQDQSIQTVHMIQAKKAQPALYDGDELLKPHHVPVIVPSSEEELELAEATRNKLHVKMNDSACVEKRVNITPPNYSKENFMATFTPQTQLTPEQVFWSLDLAKRKAEELKANAPPLPVLPPATVYPPNTPVHLVPQTLPTTSQVNIEHFEGIQKSLVTEVRAMKAVFENLEAEVDQNEIDLLSGEIERKNLLITNENLIVECLSKDVFYTATDSVLNVSRFSDMHELKTIN